MLNVSVRVYVHVYVCVFAYLCASATVSGLGVEVEEVLEAEAGARAGEQERERRARRWSTDTADDGSRNVCATLKTITCPRRLCWRCFACKTRVGFMCIILIACATADCPPLRSYNCWWQEDVSMRKGGRRRGRVDARSLMDSPHLICLVVAFLHASPPADALATLA